MYRPTRQLGLVSRRRRGLLERTQGPTTLDREGAVCEAVVREMAEGALDWLGGDLSVAVSGIAGPDGGGPEKPIGTVWIAWASRDPEGTRVEAVCEVFPGDREAVRRATVVRALQGLLGR